MTKEEKIPQYVVKFGEVEELGSSISGISGSIKNAYTNLSGTFDVCQQNIVENTNMGQDIDRLVELTEQQVTLIKEA